MPIFGLIPKKILIVNAVKQAEFLIYKFCPWELVLEIGVYNDTTKTKVLDILKAHNISTPVQIHGDWYY